VPHTKNYIDRGFAKTDIHAQNFALRYEHSMNQDWHLNADFSQTRSRTEQFDTFLYYNPGDISTLAGSHWSLNNDQAEFDVRLSGKAETGPLKHTFLVGADIQRNRYSAYSEFGWGGPSLDLSGTSLGALVLPLPGAMADQYAATPADPGTFHWNSNTDALYLQDLIAVSEQVKLLLGVRHDRFRNVNAFSGSLGASDQTTSNSHTSPRIGLIYQPTGTTSIYAVRAQAFSPNTGITLNGTPPAPDLGELKEIGLKQALGDRLSLNVAWYALKRKNMAFTDPADPSGNAILIAGETRSRGVEIDLNGQLTDALRINVAASVMRGWISAGEPGGSLVVGSEFPAMPRKTLNILGIYSFGEDKAWDVGGGVYYANAAWADNANTFKVPAQIQFDAQAAYRFDKKTQLQVNVKNLTNRRNYTSNGWGWINPGDPASVYATLRHEF
jgi:iron complex outermembrane receptor protein